MTETTTTNGIATDLLVQAQATVTEALKQKNLSKTDRAVLSVQNSTLMFLRDDHGKIVEMYPFFKAQEKKDSDTKKLLGIATGTAITAVVMLIINGIIFLFVSTPLMQAIQEAAK